MLLELNCFSSWTKQLANMGWCRNSRSTFIAKNYLLLTTHKKVKFGIAFSNKVHLIDDMDESCWKNKQKCDRQKLISGKGRGEFLFNLR